MSTVEHGGADEPVRMGRHGDRGPITVSVAVDPAEDHEHPPGGHVGDPPEVALHLGAVGGTRIPQRQVRARAAVEAVKVHRLVSTLSSLAGTGAARRIAPAHWPL